MVKKYVRVTDLVDYLICPLKVYFKRVLGIEEETREEMLVGTIVHETLDRLNRKEQDIVYEILEPMTFNQIYKIYQKYTIKIINEVIDELSDVIEDLKLNRDRLIFDILSQIDFEIYDRAQNTYTYMKNLDLYGIELWEKLTPKLISEVEVLSDRFSLVGRIDRVEDYGNSIIIGEIKTSKSLRSMYLHKIQLGAYLLLAKENFPNKKVTSTYLYYLRLRKKREIKITNNIIKKVLELKDKVLEIIEEEKVPNYEKKKFCNRCFYKKYCIKYFKIKSI